MRSTFVVVVHGHPDLFTEDRNPRPEESILAPIVLQRCDNPASRVQPADGWHGPTAVHGRTGSPSRVDDRASISRSLVKRYLSPPRARSAVWSRSSPLGQSYSCSLQRPPPSLGRSGVPSALTLLHHSPQVAKLPMPSRSPSPASRRRGLGRVLDDDQIAAHRRHSAPALPGCNHQGWSMNLDCAASPWVLAARHESGDPPSHPLVDGRLLSADVRATSTNPTLASSPADMVAVRPGARLRRHVRASRRRLSTPVFILGPFPAQHNRFANPLVRRRQLDRVAQQSSCAHDLSLCRRRRLEVASAFATSSPSRKDGRASRRALAGGQGNSRCTGGGWRQSPPADLSLKVLRAGVTHGFLVSSNIEPHGVCLLHRDLTGALPLVYRAWHHHPTCPTRETHEGGFHRFEAAKQRPPAAEARRRRSLEDIAALRCTTRPPPSTGHCRGCAVDMTFSVARADHSYMSLPIDPTWRSAARASPNCKDE